MPYDSTALPLTEGPTAAPARWTGRTWFALASLAMTVFALVFSEFLPAGILTPVAASLAISEGLAGQIVTATAVTGILGALFIGFAFGRVDRKRVMIGLCALAIVSNLIAALAPNFTVLLFARVLLGLALGGFWSLASAVVARLVSLDAIGRGMTIVMVGVSAATIAAAPVGALIAEFLGWRAAFAGGTIAAVAALAALLAGLPRLPASGPMRLGSFFILVRRPVFMVGLLAILVVVSGHFAGFTYVRPALESITHLPATQLAGLLLVFGIANFVGNPAFGAIVDRHLRFALIAASLLIGGAALSLAVLDPGVGMATAALAVWGFGFGGAPLALQNWSARAAPDHLEAMGGLLVATFQVGIASGASIGGVIVDHAGVSNVLLFTGVLVPVVALLAVLRLKWPSLTA